MLASCTEDFKDWAEPQSNPQGDVINFGNGSVAGVGLIDFAEIPDTEEWVKVCDINVPSSNDTNYYAEPTILLNGTSFVLRTDGTMRAEELKQFVISQFGKAPEVRELEAQVKTVMTNGTTAATIVSDKFPVSVVLAPATLPDLWYLVGSCIGDGSWGNDPANVGTALIPLYATNAEDFSVLTYVGYFPAGQGFKLIHKPGSWDEQWGMTAGATVKNDGSSGNIEVPADGYYQITYDMNAETLTITPYTEAVKVFGKMGMPGDYQGWNPGANLMSPMNTVAENHDWILKNVTYEATSLKFAADGSWADNWGAETFPVGLGTNGGANIPIDAGTFTVVFNDILGAYYFIQQ